MLEICEVLKRNFSIKKYKILHVIDTLDIGGAERIVTTLANIFAINGHKVGVMVLLNSSNLLINILDSNIKTYLLNINNKLNPKYFKEISSICFNYDTIHIHMRYNLRYLKLISILTKINWGKVFFHDHYGYIKNDKSIDVFTKYIIRSTKYIGVSKELCDWAEVYCNSRQTFLLENIIIKEKIDYKKKKNNLGFHLVLVSNIHPRKNIEFAIKIIHELNKKGVYYLDIIGQKTNKKYFNNICSLISKYKLDHFINIDESCSNIQKIIHNYDLGLHTSKSETGPLVLIEYLAHNLPFITFKTGEVVEKIKIDLDLLIVDNFEYADWIYRIEKLLLMNKKNIEKDIETIYKKYFSPSSYYNQCIQIYQKNLIS